MLQESKYIEFQVNDFVEDDGFRKWITAPDQSSNRFWNDFIQANPQLKETIRIAREIVETVYFEEAKVPKEKYTDSLVFLKDYLSSKTSKVNYLNVAINWWSRVAAILIIPFIIGGVIYLSVDEQIASKPKLVQYMVSNGEKSKVILADGTFVWLNSGSKLDYIIDNHSSVRKVHLSGEAYFDVSKDDKKPFLVETKNYTVKVYGTRFNVNSYDSDKTSETILEEGSVSILFNNQKEEVKIVPGQRFLLNENNKYSITKVDTDLYSCWKDNVLRLSNERLEDLIVRLERWYGVKIQVEDFNRFKDLKYTLSIKTESLREMLELMKFITPFEYEIDGENVFLTYQ
ncbi:FecR family protein [Sunxiuqinia sp. A32]|uniref:FecR family protein n=1 Tax=Sunxiuqinia sp. A32 TaxID=3461496 RepID=UPI0040455B5E